jgi:ABC-type phosphate/phosphonate transport system permease subunit
MNTFKAIKMKANEQVMACLTETQNENAGVFQFLVKHSAKMKIVGYGFLGLILCLLFTFGMTDMVMATDPGGQVFTRANTAMQGVLRQIRTISSIIAALFLTIAFLMKMLSKNQRTVDEANTWIKRIAVAWACINAVGFILTFIQEIIGPDVTLPTIP